MSSVNPWAGTGLGGDAYPVVNEHGHQVVKNGELQYIRRGQPGFAEVRAVAKWRSNPRDPRDLSEVLAAVEATDPIRERDIHQCQDGPARHRDSASASAPARDREAVAVSQDWEIRVDRSQLYQREARLEYGVQDGRYFSVYRGRVTGIEPDSAEHRWLDAHQDHINSLLTWVDQTAPIKERDIHNQDSPARHRDSAAGAPARDRRRSR